MLEKAKNWSIVHPLRQAKRGLWRRAARVLDLCHHLANRGQSALPPPSLRTVGAGDFHRVGSINVRNLKQFSSLDGKRVLEIGCGSGRNALALTSYDVEYDGFDIYRPYVDWCATHVSRDFPQFRFHHADLYNGQYNPRGRLRSEDFRFPLADESFDVVFLTSVFTHMLEGEVRRYLQKISRLTRPGGIAFTTWFLLNADANRLIAEGRSYLPMVPFGGERVKVVNRHVPEDAVAFDETLVQDAFAGHRMPVIATRYGAWCGRATFFDYQDVVVARRA